MSKMIKKAAILLLAVVIILGTSITAFAAGGTVTYDGDADKFVYTVDSEYSPTDLFTGFKNIMPGDKITERIVLKNVTTENYKIAVYMRALGATEDSEKFLSQLNLTVKQENSSTLFEAPADQTAQLTDWVYLGTIGYKGEIPLDVTLEVPITMGNEFQNAIGILKWAFKVEEIPTQTTDITEDDNVVNEDNSSDTENQGSTIITIIEDLLVPLTGLVPKTGDESPLILYGVLFVLVLTGLAGLYRLKKNRTTES